MNSSYNPRPERVPVVGDRKYYMKWTQGWRYVVSTDPVTSVVCLMISKQGVLMFTYDTKPKSSDVEDRPDTAHQEKAQSVLDHIHYWWNEDDDVEEDMPIETDMRIFILFPDQTSVSKEYKDALAWLAAEICRTLEQRFSAAELGFQVELLEYTNMQSHLSARIEVAHDGTDSFPKVSLNGVQKPPALPIVTW